MDKTLVGRLRFVKFDGMISAAQLWVDVQIVGIDLSNLHQKLELQNLAFWQIPRCHCHRQGIVNRFGLR